MNSLYFKYIFTKFSQSLLNTFISLLLVVFVAETALCFPFSSTKTLLLHLTAIFFKRLDLLAPLTFLISIITTISSMHKANELIAFEVSGISKSKIVTPFFLLSLAACLTLYCCHQFIIPKTSSWLIDEQKHFVKVKNPENFEVRILCDGSRIIYTPQQNSLTDLYWIQSHKEIWHFEKVSFEEEFPIGIHVDKMQKNALGQFTKTASYHKYSLPAAFLKAKPKIEKRGSLSIFTLFFLLTKHVFSLTSDKGYIYSLLCYKMITPWFSTMIVTALLPILLPYRKRIKTTNLYLIGTLCFFLFHTLIKASIILAEHYVVSPLLTIILLPLLLQSMLSFRLWQMVKSKPNTQTQKSLLRFSVSSSSSS